MTVAEDRALVRAHNERRREWRILPVDDWYVLERYIEYGRVWVEVYRAPTWDECDAAYDAYANGERPEGSECWP